MTEAASRPRRTLEVFLAFLVQGLTAFGGPVAHLGYFRRAFVERRAWLDDAAFADLTALCQFLPGPASSQLGMAIGLRRAGLPGALAAWLGFTLPAATTMIVFAQVAPELSARFGDGWIHGLKIAAAAVVAQALIAMARSLASGPITGGMAIGAAAGLILAPGPAPQILALLAGAAFGLAFIRAPAPAVPDAAPPGRRRHALVALALFGALLGGLTLAAPHDRTLALAAVFYRAGSLVFGGGHVVLPLLESQVVGPGWLDRDTFLSGYGFVQAVPGPLFSFAGFVGASQTFAPNGWRGGTIAVIAIFLPSLLLVLGVLPFWDRLKTRPAARGALAGVNAVVVGVLAAALWSPVLTGVVRGPGDVALIAAAFLLLAVVRAPPWSVVAGAAILVGVFAA